MEFPLVKKSIKIDGKEVILETGRFAPQANAAVLARLGDTIVLATVTSSAAREDINYFPLYVEYQEKLYAGGKIKGSRWVKREGRPTDESILTGRLIDRSIRPFFPKGYKNEVQVVITTLSFDGENDPDILAICAVSAALAISDIPWNGPIGAVRVGLKENSFFANPVYQELEFSDIDFVVSGTADEIVMIEAGADEVSEEKIISALEFGLVSVKSIVTAISELQKKVGQKKQAFEPYKLDPKLLKKVEKEAGKTIASLVSDGEGEKVDFSVLKEIKEALAEKFEDNSKSDVSSAVDEYFKQLVREKVLAKKIRIDGRKIDKVRKLSIETSVLPRTHGSAVFQRGLTQALTITTLGSPSLEQWIEGLEGDEIKKRYIHHYYMPPYSVGEVGRLGWPSRREVGHGALAERALLPVLPAEDKFPYTIRVVSEITSSNGSTSMASVCGSSLSLMDAGVPIKKPVAGIAMGLMAKTEKDKTKTKIKDFVVLTDILGLEDHIGDMDFKVAGTKDGITALQMDVKILGITVDILSKGLVQAKEARLYILGEMKKVISVPRSSVSQYAPKVAVIKVDKEKIGEVIGPGGRTIRQIISETGVAVDVDDEGNVTISGAEKEGISKALNWIEGLTREVEAGEEFVGEVKRIQPFGAFVEVLPGKEGLVHVSEMSTEFVGNPEEVVELGQKIKVRVKEIDDMGRINLSMLFGEDANKPKQRRQPDFQRRKPGFKKPGNKKTSSMYFKKKY
ncbi:polyribonucleotide nucleotidyltransferase [Patescibacteria group bacterium]